MTDEEYAAMAQKLGLAGEGLVSPSQIDAIGARQATPPSTDFSLTEPRFAISNAPAGTSTGIGRETVNRFATDESGSRGLSSDALRAVLAPADTGAVDSSALNKAIDSSMQYHQQKAAGQQASIDKAIATLGDIDATDEQKNQAHATIQNIPTVYNRTLDQNVVVNPVPSKSALLAAIQNQFPDTPNADELATRLQRNQFISNITPPDDASMADLKERSLNTGASYRMLQDLGLQFPGSTSKYATAPIFKPDAPPPAQKIERAQPVPGQTVDASGKVVQAPASGIGLTTVRGTEFGQIDNPARGGYTEAGWNVGAWGGDIASTKDPFVALPVSILNQYGNSGDKDFADKFNSKYDVQDIDPATGKVVVASLRDKGPGAKTGAGIDMGWATREQLGLQPGFSGNISYRVVPKGSALPDNTTQSVQQTQQNVAAHSGQFATGTNPGEVYIKPIDPNTIKDPWVHGSSMSTADVAQWAKHQTDQYASAMDSANTPLTMEEYKAQYQKFFEGGSKYLNQDLKLEPVDAEHNDQFASLANLVSPTGASYQGKPVSQLDLMEQSFLAAKKALPAGAMVQIGPYSEEKRLYEAQQEHLVPNIARGLMGQKGNLSESEQAGARKTLPEAGDSEALGQQKMAILRQSIQDQMRRIIAISKAEHHDTSALEQQYRQIFVQSKVQQQAQNQANKIKAQNIITAQQGGGATQAPTPAQQRAAAEANAVKNPPPTF